VRRVLAGLVVVPFVMGAAAAPASQQKVVFRFADPDIAESSGLVVRDGRFWTVNDSGDSGRVFVVDPATGETAYETTWTPDPTDVEAVSVGPRGEAYVGDIGDNRAVRDSVQVLRMPVRDGSVEPEVFDLTYPDGPQDAETLMVDPTDGTAYVGSKGLFGGTLYRAPLDASAPGVMEPVGAILGLATDGAFFPDGRHVIVRDYGRARIYAFPDLTVVATIDLPEQEQGEGIAVAEDGRVYVSSEGTNAPVLRVPLPAAVRDVVTPPPPTPKPTPPQVESREGVELPETTETERPAWPWFLGGFIGVGVIVVLMRSLRRR
jgi:outer membrane protein assembly factor BamB